MRGTHLVKQLLHLLLHQSVPAHTLLGRLYPRHAPSARNVGADSRIVGQLRVERTLERARVPDRIVPGGHGVDKSLVRESR